MNCRNTQRIAERGTNMRQPRLIAASLGLLAVCIFAADASAYYHPTLGRFMSRDPGAGGAIRIGAGAPAAAGGFASRDQYTDGMNLYQSTRSNPVVYVDSDGAQATRPVPQNPIKDPSMPDVEFPPLPDSADDFDPGINYYGNHKSKTMADLIARYGRAIGYLDECTCVDPCTVLALIWIESRGDPHAYRYEPRFYQRYLKNKKPWVDNPYYNESEHISSSYGPLQIMYPTAYELGYRGTPEGLTRGTGIQWGMKYFCKQMKRYDNRKLDAVAAYNAGGARRSTNGSYQNQGYVDKYESAYRDCVAAGGNRHE
jgi:hypothetical protein